MSERSKVNRKAREAKQAKRVVFWIGAVLILLTLAYVIVVTVNS